MVLRREITAVADILSATTNEAKTAEEVAEAAIKALDEVRARSNRLAVITNYAWRSDEEPSLAFIGPFGTRATSAASAAGSAMAGTPRGGTGKWMLVPAYSTARAAWDAIGPPSKHEQRLREFLASIRSAHANNPSVWDPLMPPGSAAPCCCGVRSGGWCQVHAKRNP